jgi:hypothetical protein
MVLLGPQLKAEGRHPAALRLAGWLALALMLCAALARDAALLARTPVAVGVDGYYYVLQLDTLRNYGHLYYPTGTPLVLYILSGIRLVTGDSVLAVKVGSALLNALLCLGVYALVRSVTGRVWLGVFGFAVAALSSLHLYLIVEFVNSLGALSLLVWSAWGAVRALRTRSAKWAAFSAVLLLAALLSHRLIAPLVLLLVALAALTRPLLSTGEDASGNRYAALSVLLLLFCAPAILAAQPLINLPQWVRSEFLIVPRWPLRRFDAAEGCMLLFASAATLARAARGVRPRGEKAARSFFATVALWALLVSLNPFLNHNTGFLGITGRLSSLFHVQAAILLPGSIWLLKSAGLRARLLVAALSLAALSVGLTAPLPFGATAAYLAARERLVSSLRERPAQLCQRALIIAPHGEQFVVTAVGGVPAQQRPPSDAGAGCTYWLLHRAPKAALLDVQNTLYEEEDGSAAALVRGEDLGRLLGGMGGAERRRLLGANPHLREALRGQAGDGQAVFTSVASE